MPDCSEWMDAEGNCLVRVSTDSPEDTATYCYGDWTDALVANWDPRMDISVGVRFPPAPVKFPTTPTVPPSIRIKFPVICLPHESGGP